MYSFVWSIGTLILLCTLLVINRNFFWLPWYNFFYPLILGYIITVLGIDNPITMIIITSTTIWWIAYKMIHQQVHLLLYTRHMLYFLFSMLSLFLMIAWANSIFPSHIITFTSLNQTALLSFIIITSMMQRVYGSGKWYNSLTRWSYIIRFIILWYGCNIIITSNIIQNFFIINPWSIISIIILAMIAWMYTGLQVKEMIRFRKLIWAKITNKKKRNS